METEAFIEGEMMEGKSRTLKELVERADVDRLVDGIKVHKMFTGQYCAQTKIDGYAFVGYGYSHQEAIDDIFGQINYAKGIKII